MLKIQRRERPLWVRKVQEDFPREVGTEVDLKGWEGFGESGEERHSRLGQRRCGWLYTMPAQATTNRPAFFECKVYIGKYKKVS